MIPFQKFRKKVEPSILVTHNASSGNLFAFKIIEREDFTKGCRSMKPIKLNRKDVYIPSKRVRANTQLFRDLFHPDFNIGR